MLKFAQLSLATILSTALAGFGVAHAQDEAPAEETTEGGDAAMTGEETTEGGDAAATGEETSEGGDMATEGAVAPAHHGMTLAKGGLKVHAVLGVGMSKDNGGDPISLSPDIWYGVSDKLTVGLTHSIAGTTGFWSGANLGIAGASLCLSGDLCLDEVYTVGGVQAKFSLKEDEKMGLAAVGGLIYNIVDPFRLGLRAGVAYQMRSGKMMIDVTPSLYLGLNERDAGNKESLFVPVALMFSVNEQLGVGVQTGIRGALDGFGDNYSIPVAFGAKYKLNANMGMGGAFVLERIAGFEGPEAADLRSLAVFFDWSK